MMDKWREKIYSKKRFFGSWYSYIKQIQVPLLNTLPPFARNIIFKLLFQNFGSNTFIDYGFYFRYPKKISIGQNVEINRNCAFYPSFIGDKGRIYISDAVIIAPNVSIYCAGHSPNSLSRIDLHDDVIIEENVYIGANATLRFGVKIGKNSTIGMGSVVVTDIPENCIAAGNPATPIRFLDA